MDYIETKKKDGITVLSKSDDAERGGKVAVISGAAGGIGAGICRGFLAEGYEVIGIDKPASAWEAPGFRYLSLDVTDDAAVAAFGAGLARVDALVNAAGINRRREEYTMATFEAVLDVNLKGTMRLCLACKPHLSAAHGAIVNIASMHAFFGAGHAPGYAASKGGVAQLTKALAIEWAKENIRVNAIAPGWIHTAMTQPVIDDPVRNRSIMERTPLGRWGKPDDLVGPALFLAGDAARFVTGVILPVDGGYLIT
jgi:NAD(P)-dependent dehydrogenase (short-subunit alcohol dehydrogenase family)